MNMKESQYGPCGIYCGACGAADCGGCQSNIIDDSVEQCNFRRCSKDKESEFCCFCSEYPCTELHKFMNDKWPHHWTMEPNLAYIKQNGKDNWLHAQKKEWSCKSCGAEIKWYQKKCSCGQELEAWDVPVCMNACIRSLLIKLKRENPEGGERCVVCGESVRNTLDTHHLDGDSRNNDPENLVILCVSCHRIIDKAKSPKEALQDFQARHKARACMHPEGQGNRLRTE